MRETPNSEIGPGPGPDISFEMPAHEMCTERRAVLRRADGQSEWMTFVIDFMPDKILINGRKFVYGGVADGRGFYREESKDNRERRSEFSPRPGSVAESIEFETNYCFGAGQVVEDSHDSGPDLHTTASPCDNMPCSRCSEVLDQVSKMIENPPGLSGIKCHLGHVGNHYVDAGWVEALTRVKAHLVTGRPGTREKI